MEKSFSRFLSICSSVLVVATILYYFVLWVIGLIVSLVRNGLWHRRTRDIALAIVQVLITKILGTLEIFGLYRPRNHEQQHPDLERGFPQAVENEPMM